MTSLSLFEAPRKTGGLDHWPAPMMDSTQQGVGRPRDIVSPEDALMPQSGCKDSRLSAGYVGQIITS